jgi:ABC-type Na+ transport system ATPase subunit NatA
LTGVGTLAVDGLAPVNETVESPVFLGDKIGKKISADLTKSLTINQRFMFLRDLFKGNEAEMNRALTHLNASQTLEEALDYLNDNYSFPWKTEAGIAFKELLEKRFA